MQSPWWAVFSSPPCPAALHRTRLPTHEDPPFLAPATATGITARPPMSNHASHSLSHPPFPTPRPPRGPKQPFIAGRVPWCGRCRTASLVHCRHRMACTPAIHLACSDASALAYLSAAGVVPARVAPLGRSWVPCTLWPTPLPSLDPAGGQPLGARYQRHDLRASSCVW